MDRRPDENEDANASKRWKPSDLLLRRGNQSNKTFTPATASRPTTNNAITPATASRPTTNNAITPATASQSTTMRSKYQESNQSILDAFITNQKAQRSDINGLIKSILDKKQRLEDEAKKDSIDINLICPEIRSVDDSLLKQFDTLSVQLRNTKSNWSKTVILNQELKSQLSAQSKKMSDTCNNLNRQLAKQRDNAIQANKDRDETQSKLDAAERQMNTLRSMCQTSKQQLTVCQQSVELAIKDRDDIQLKLNDVVAARDATVNHLESELKYREMDLNELNKDHTNLSKYLAQLTQTIEDLKQDNDRLKKEIDDLCSKMSDYSVDRASLMAKAITAQDDYRRLVSKTDKEIDDVHDKNESLAAENSTLANNLMLREGELNTAMEQLEAAGIKMSTLLSEHESLTTDKESFVAQLNTATEQLEAGLIHRSSDESNIKRSLHKSEMELECLRFQLDQKEQFIEDLNRRIFLLERDQDTSSSTTPMSVEEDFEISFDANNESNDVFNNNNDDSSDVLNVETNEYIERNVETNEYIERIASLESQLQHATTKKYAPIDPIITLAKIPDESKTKVQTLSRSFPTIAEMPTMNPVLRQEILAKINFDKFVLKFGISRGTT
jgi:chromosome segregation ATPase